MKALHDAVVEEIESNMPLMNEDEPAGGDDFVPDDKNHLPRRKEKHY